MMPFIRKSVAGRSERGKLDCAPGFRSSGIYKSYLISSHFRMNFENPIALVVVGLIALVLGVIVFSYFSPQARRERIRRKNNARIVSKAGRPAVKFSVRTKKKKK
jgi:hypothetical protein